MKTFSGNLLKMKSDLQNPVKYNLPIGNELLPLNPLIGKKIQMKFEGQINCIATGEQIKKSYNQGYSYKSFITLARCDVCIVKPELCHYDEGTCREPQWGEKHCMQPHIIYLANTSGLKVGITRKSQIPTRWIDQGATEALPILEVPSRYQAGLIEVKIKESMADKTNWRKMLQGPSESLDLYQYQEEVFESFGPEIDEFDAIDLEEEIIDIHYPVEIYPEKVKSLSFDKISVVEGTLQGIKGQYLILDTGVINIRKHQGYYIDFSY